MLLGAAALWGTGFTVTKYSVGMIDPFWYAAMRYSLSVPLLLVIFRRRLKEINSVSLRSGIIQGALMSLAFILQALGSVYTTAGKNAFLCTTYVVIIPFICRVLKKTRLTVQSVTAAAVCAAGIGLLSGGGAGGMNKGDVISLMSGFAWAASIYYQSEISGKSSPGVLITVQMAAAAVINTSAALIIAPFPTEIPAEAVGAIIYNTVFCVIGGFFLQISGQKTTAPCGAGIILSLEAVFAALSAAMFLHETMSVKMLIGSALIFSAVIISNFRVNTVRRGSSSDGQI